MQGSLSVLARARTVLGRLLVVVGLSIGVAVAHAPGAAAQ
ncbi:MAG: hypothetical protein QOG90_815, partial [Actinomycetota bacterium]